MEKPDVQQFLSFVARLFGVDRVSPETAYGSIPQWDSVMQLRLVLEIESAYGVEIPIDEVAGLDTLEKFWAKVRASHAVS